MSFLINYLKNVTAWQAQPRKGYIYGTVEEFVLKEGRRWKAAKLPNDVERAKPKACFANALLLATARRDLYYVEGFAFSIVPFLHAWCVDVNGIVVDPTLSNPEDCEFYGVVFRKNWVVGVVSRRGCYGVLDNPEENWPLLRKKQRPWYMKEFNPKISMDL